MQLYLHTYIYTLFKYIKMFQLLPKHKSPVDDLYSLLCTTYAYNLPACGLAAMALHCYMWGCWFDSWPRWPYCDRGWNARTRVPCVECTLTLCRRYRHIHVLHTGYCGAGGLVKSASLSHQRQSEHDLTSTYVFWSQMMLQKNFKSLCKLF